MVLTETNLEVKPLPGVATTTKVVLTLEYDGTRYHGFQWQAGPPTIQEEVERAIEKLTGENLRLMAASRTDAGVHAREQVISFRTECSHSLATFISGLNYYLPDDIAVKTAHRVRDSFSVRSGAISREYNYYIWNSSVRSPLQAGFSYLVDGHLNIDTMNQACQALLGEHDFASFTSGIGADVKKTVRRVYRAEVSRDGNLVIFNMAASSFLAHQVRNTVGLLIRIGQGKMTIAELSSIISARKHGMAGPTAPACGLCLMRVNYPRPFEEER
ncbi:MAG: tRNA pseudouridine synthase [Dehalococcoidales bacterium]|nr:tRNA pseudouridine synthase [Dehalococcoidales bacterium]